MPELHPWTLLAIAGLTLISVLTRSFFFISRRALPLSPWMRRGLQYAPIAALAAVTAPGVLPQHAGVLLPDWRDARLWAALATVLYYYWRRRDLMVLPASIVAGLAVFLLLRGLSWAAFA